MAEKKVWHEPKLVSLDAALTAQADNAFITDDATAHDPVAVGDAVGNSIGGTADAS